MGRIVMVFIGPPRNEFLTKKVYLMILPRLYLIIRIGNRYSWNLLKLLACCSPEQGICGNRISLW